MRKQQATVFFHSFKYEKRESLNENTRRDEEEEGALCLWMQVPQHKIAILAQPVHMV